MADCLSNSVVLRKLLPHFSNTELLKLSIVNKLWNYEARSVMRNRGNLIARLKFHDTQPCPEYLDTFAAMLLLMNVVPFSGIFIKLDHYVSTCQNRLLQTTCDTILDRLQLKSFSVALAGKTFKNKQCPGSTLALQLLDRFCGALEEVSIDIAPSEQDDLFVGLIADDSFPNLKILKLGENYEGCDPTEITDLLTALVDRSPKLQELHTQGPINLMLNVLERSSAMLVVQSNISAPFDEIPDDAINRIRLEKMVLRYTGASFNMARFNRITPWLMQTSCTATLHSIEVDAVLALSLMSFGIRLENVSFLKIGIDFSILEQNEPRVLTIIKDFDFTRIFPNLHKVTLFHLFRNLRLSPDHRLIEQVRAALTDAQPDRAINIKELHANLSISTNNAEFYAQMFPDIKQLQVLEVHQGEGDISFGSIWKHWVNLEVLDVLVHVQKHLEDLDSVICGIFPEEVTELRQKDEEFLKKVNIVPVMPAITCLRNLRKFMVVFAPLIDRVLGCIDVASLPLMLSKVTGLVAFARCPNLVVELSTSGSPVHEALRQMEPYASVKIGMSHYHSYG